MINYGKQSIDSVDIKSVVKALKSNFLTQGPLVEKFELQLKKTLRSKHATVVNNGSSALITIGKILEWKKGDLIAVPPITFLSSVNAIEHCCAKPLFIDISMKDYCMDPDKLELALQKDGKKKIKAAVIVDYGGQPAQWEKFLALKRKYNIKLINDNCHALGSTLNRDKGYAVKYADLVSLSFHPVKAITTGEGGAILTNNINYEKKAKILRTHGIIRKTKEHWKYSMEELGYNFRLSDINCALGISQLKKLNKFIVARKKIAKFYDKLFIDELKFNVPKKNSNVENSYHLYPLLVDFDKIKKTKDQIIKEFLKNKIKLQVHYIPVNTQPYFKKKYKYKKTNFQKTNFFFERCISFPIYYDLKINQLRYIKIISKKIFNIK